MSQKADTSNGAIPLEFEELIEEARSAERAGQFALARQRYERALRQVRRPEHVQFAASLLRWIGSAYRDEGDGEAALDCYEASLAIAEVNADRHNMAHAFNCMGIVQWQWGYLDSADELYERARALAQEAKDLRLVAMVQQNMGVIANIRGDLVRALRHYRDSLDGYRQLGDHQYMGQLLNNLGMIHTDLKQWDAAEGMFAEAASVAEQVSDLGARVMVEVNRTELCLLQKDYARARECCDAAFELASRLDHRLGLGEVYKNYGIIYREMGKYNLAETHLKTASEIAERYTSPLLAGEVQRELAQVYRVQDRNREALQALNYAHRVFNDLRAKLDLADIDQRIHELEDIFFEVVRKWGESIESKDRYTAGHCQRVADYSSLLARAVGFDEQTITWLRMGAFLHDVGKTVVPADILNKEGKLTRDEWEIMRRHTLMGVELLSAIEFPWDVRPMVRSHHEHWDGSGYPESLKGRSIPLSARILCVADVFDALTTTRSYRRAYAPDEALDIMERDAGTIFDPELFAVFRRVVAEKIEAGALAVGG
ncbi:MAG: tetratricopeptide repeat protein [Gemmatimonadetes bacterium]|nr:tetratricopeptide repeat protein [Gemmatimonadota bacterium]